MVLSGSVHLPAQPGLMGSNLSYMIKNLEEQGIEIEIIMARDDVVFSPEKIKEENPDLYDHMHLVEGGHREIFLDHERIMKVVDELFNKD